jgi:cytochrome P450
MTRQYPPGPPGWLGLGLVRQIRSDPMAFYARMFREYGDCVHMRFGPYHDYVFFHPDHVKEILITKAKHFRRFRRPLDVLAQWNGRNSLIITEGAEWLRQRRLAQPAFHQRRLAGYAETVVELTRRWIEGVARVGRHSSMSDSGDPGGRPTRGTLSFDIVKELTELALTINTRVLFGADVFEAAPRIGEAVGILSAVGAREFTQPFSLPDWLPLPGKAKKRWAIRYLDETVRELIRRWRVEGQDHGDLLSMFLLAVDEEGDGRSMTDDEARDSLVTMLLAGHDTVSAGIIWIWYMLTQHPEVEARVLAELQAVLGERPPTGSDLPRLVYLDQVVKETLRLYPPAPTVLTRQTISEVEIGGYPLPKGSLVHPFAAVTQRDPRWFPEPDKFDPERFAPGRMERLPQFAYFPFGGGPRVCIGNSMAMMVMTLVTATVWQRLRLTLAPDQGPVEWQVLLSLRPKGELRMVASSRTTSGRETEPADLAASR